MAEATAVSFRGGTELEHDAFRGAAREITVDTTNTTLWVHPGNNNKGTPLARADMANVTAADIAQTGIAKTDLSNVAITNPTLVKNLFSDLHYANDSMDNVNTVNLATSTGHSGPNLAYANMSNVTTTNLATGAGTTHQGKDLAYTDLSNITTATPLTDGTITPKLAKADLSNITSATALTDGTITPKLAKADLTNITSSDPLTNGTIAGVTVLAKADLSNVTSATALTDGTITPKLATADLSNLTALGNTAIQNQAKLVCEATANKVTQIIESQPSNVQYPTTGAVIHYINGTVSRGANTTLSNIQSWEVATEALGSSRHYYEYVITVSAAGSGYTEEDVCTCANTSIGLILLHVENGAITSIEPQSTRGFNNTAGELDLAGGTGTGGKITVTLVDITSTVLYGNLATKPEITTALNTKIQLVSALPASPVPGVLYLIPEA